MTRLPKNKLSVSVSIPLDLLAEIDEIAYADNENRSVFIVDACRKEVAKRKQQQQTKQEKRLEFKKDEQNY